jgi:hypothetical protein
MKDSFGKIVELITIFLDYYTTPFCEKYSNLEIRVLGFDGLAFGSERLGAARSGSEFRIDLEEFLEILGVAFF